MSDHHQPSPAIATNIKHHIKKILLIFLTIALLAGSGLFLFAADKVKQSAEQSLLIRINETLNGQIMVESIDLSLLGSVEANQVQLIDASGKILLKNAQVQIRYNWSDLLKGQLGPQLITRVVMKHPEINLIYQQDRLNWTNLLKSQPTDANTFSSVIEVQDGKLYLETPFFTKTVNQIEGQLDCRQTNQLGLALAGLLDQTPIQIDGQWGAPENSVLSLSAQGLDLTKLGLTGNTHPVQLTSGRLDDLNLRLSKDTSGNPQLQSLSGRLSGVTTTGSLRLTQCSARFEKQETALFFSDVQARYREQPVTAAGKVFITPDDITALDFSVQMPSGDPAALFPELQASGPLTAQAVVSGSVLAPVVNGQFSLNSLHSGTLSVSNISGTFSYADNPGNLLQLSGCQGIYKGQPITAAGQIFIPADEAATLDIAVYMSGADPAAILPSLRTGGSLSARVSITGPAQAPAVSGDFSLGSLQFSDITVSGIDGSFSYVGQTLQLHSANGATTDGFVSGSGTIDPAAEQYVLYISGNGLNSSRLTTRDVSGPLSFSGTANGNAAAALVQGGFVITNGHAYGIPFQRLSGDFIKQGSAETEVSNLVLQTSFGTFYPERLSQDIMSQLQQYNLPTSEAEIKTELQKELQKELKKALQNILK
ncbi:MAG TPA: hypothetical protein VN611_16395 [Patescibacteria group bacterium]|nr:hypothetical protein [Patescibacteria group bacterium]